MRIGGSEFFAIGCGERFGLGEDDVALLYSPMRGEVALVDGLSLSRLLDYAGERCFSSSDDEVKELFDAFFYPQVDSVEVRDGMRSERMSIIPNLTCNFSCSYCYSARGRSGVVMEWDTARSALDFFIDRGRVDGQHLSLFISGGGEPLASWPLTRRIIEYGRERARREGLTISISVITNGSLITAEIADVLRDNDCTVGVSFEVIEDLQNLQRKMWQRVGENIRLLHERGVRVKINSTITPLSVGRMEEMLLTVARDYPFVAEYTMEPVTSTDLFSDASHLGAFYDEYFSAYLRCSEQSRRLGVNLRFTFDDAMRGITPRHCPGKFCLTPTGKISVCHLVSSPKEERFDSCIYGEVKGDGVVIDREKFARLYDINVSSHARCRDCFAKWDCGGECMTRNALYPEAFMEQVCRFNKRFILHSLLEKVATTIREEHNMTIDEYVRS